MAKDLVIIGSRLPHGLILTHPQRPSEKIEVKGLSSLQVKNKKTGLWSASSNFYATTEVDADFWAAWKMANSKNFKPLESGALFEAPNLTLAAGKAREVKKERTGFEPADPEKFGVEPATTK
jgi:hypothetical protein